MMNANVIALLKGMVCPPNDGMDNRIAVSTIQSKLMQYAFMLDEDAFQAMSKADLSWIVAFHDEAITFLRDMTGGAKDFAPLYRNFPQEVMTMSQSQLFCNAIHHYFSNGTWVPSSDLSFVKDIKFENVKFTMLKSGNEKDFDNIFTSLVSVGTSLMPQDMEMVKWFVSSGRPLMMPDQIPFKGNLSTLAAMGIPNLPIKNPTDVLRIAVHMSGGDISLPKVPRATVKSISKSYARNYRKGYKTTVLETQNPEREKFKFKSFTRKERKYIMDLLESTNCSTSEMVLKDQRWIKLAHGLHAGDYAKSHPKAFAAINTIRNEKVVSWYGKLEQAFKKSLEDGLVMLSGRPGEFMRRIDVLIRNNQYNDKAVGLIMEYFNKSVMDSSNKVLFELYAHFENRLEQKKSRYIKIKGARKSTQLPILPAIRKEIVSFIQESVFETLKNKFTTLPSLGNCYIDEKLKKIPLPTNMRSLNFSLKPTIRGTRIPFSNQNAKVIRPFIHWTDKHGSEDLDLSAVFVSSTQSDILDYHDLRLGSSCHSGDVRHRQGACAEYIDIDINDALNKKYKYVVISVKNFNGGTLSSVDSLFGLMEREFPEQNNTWLPESISNTTKCEGSGSDILLSILDLQTKEYIFLDVEGNGERIAGINEAMQIINEYATDPAISVYDLMMMHINGRGRQVTIDQNPDNCFLFEDFCQDYVKTAQYMGI